MTPTEQVRSKLDTHGVEWMSRHTTNSTFVKTREGNVVELYESGLGGKFIAYNLTPEQAAKIGVFLA